MGLILLIVGFVLFIGTFVKPKNEADAKKLEMFRNHKWIFRIGGFIVMVIGSALMTGNTTQSTVQTSNQQEAKQTQASSISGTDLKKAVVSFYKQNYPEATIGGGNNDAIIQFPYKNTTLTVDVGDISDGVFTVNCFIGMRLARNLGSKECLSTEDKAGRSIIDAFYHIYDIKKPSEEEFIESLRHKCIERECDIKNMTVIASGNKKYTLNIHSEYISPGNKHIQYVMISVQ
ncbi:MULTISPECIES: hypothetical protein [unclassified Hydrogenobaculum]|uniref:hypothetical protein n=1 Tax=unclassified Hydrogenobaculum TaxID=2622382 RepID=UPI0001C51C13|nr:MULTISPECIES: hypothetical protein [unclassified Hydrogenobaculum]AEF19473.1 hypothetical protein Hyd3684_1086 [Hydrogenobaculum sp. 3684]AEG46761.1 hypothetical protein HydSHO_1087 [Hydrogenobaculum sp. SHO]AGG15406.1 hypothetical protein HydHO_1091 [Hydrogenobaculum sp. HO]AGH93708.1 hypothetical protein HydSN_1119 [Hydrogenobaculum sp. SN]